jgi:hypothetical protein
VPNQVIDEFRRNRDGKIADALRQFTAQKLDTPFPQLAKDYPEYQELRDLRSGFQNKHAELVEHLTSDAAGQRFKADSTIGELLDAATRIALTDDLLNAARHRSQVGNPPGKKGSLGDAINWEALLANGADEDLYFASEDKDYASALDDRVLDSFLAAEWLSKKGSRVFLYKRLSQFFAAKFPDIKLAAELEKELLIRELGESENFRQTHKVIRDLRQLSDFTPTQVNDIVTAAVNNDQVFRIIADEDVRAFLERVISGHENDVNPKALEELKVVFGEADAERANEEA